MARALLGLLGRDEDLKHAAQLARAAREAQRLAADVSSWGAMMKPLVERVRSSDAERGANAKPRTRPDGTKLPALFTISDVPERVEMAMQLGSVFHEIAQTLASQLYRPEMIAKTRVKPTNYVLHDAVRELAAGGFKPREIAELIDDCHGARDTLAKRTDRMRGYLRRGA